MRLTLKRYVLVVALAAVAWAAVASASLILGPAPLWTFGGDSRWDIFDARLERVLTASLVGAALAVGGVALQALLRNPLAEPFVLGISGGAALGVILGKTLLPAAWFVVAVPLVDGGSATLSVAGLCGFATAALTILAVCAVARQRGRLDPYRLILAGIVMSAFFSAAIMLTASVAPPQVQREIFKWLMGGLHSERVLWGELAIGGVLILGGIAVFIYQARGFNLLAFGEDVATSLGLNVERHRVTTLVVAALLAGWSVSLAGPIGFVGLVVPHILRLWLGPDHRLLIPVSAFGGAVFLAAADRLVQSIPYEIVGGLPVGVVTAMCGVPFFILLMRRGRRTPGGAP